MFSPLSPFAHLLLYSQWYQEEALNLTSVNSAALLLTNFFLLMAEGLARSSETSFVWMKSLIAVAQEMSQEVGEYFLAVIIFLS